MLKPDKRVLFSKPFSQYSRLQILKVNRGADKKKFVLNQDIRIQAEAEPIQTNEFAYATKEQVKIVKRDKRSDLNHKQFPSLGHYSPKYDLVQKRQPNANIRLESFHSTKNSLNETGYLEFTNYPKIKVKGFIELSKQSKRMDISTYLEGPHPERFSSIRETYYKSRMKNIPAASFYQSSPRDNQCLNLSQRTYSPKYHQVRKNIRGSIRFEKTLGRQQKIDYSLTFNEGGVVGHDQSQISNQHHGLTFFKKDQQQLNHIQLPSYMNKLNRSRLQLDSVCYQMLEQNGNL